MRIFYTSALLLSMVTLLAGCSFISEKIKFKKPEPKNQEYQMRREGNLQQMQGPVKTIKCPYGFGYEINDVRYCERNRPGLQY